MVNLYLLALGVLIVTFLGFYFKSAVKFCLVIIGKLILGTLVLIIINLIVDRAGYSVPVNFVTVTLVGFFGSPGLLMLFLMKFVLNIV